MISPTSLYNEIVGGILSRFPAGQAMYSQMRNSAGRTSRTADAATASREVTNPNAPRNGEPVHVSFNTIMELFADESSQGQDYLRKIIETEIESAAARHDIDPNLVRALIRVESSYRPDAVSHAGAMGLMQLMPRTAESLGVTDPFDIHQNIHGGTAYLRRMLDMFDQDLTLALAAYNAGQGNVRRHGGVPPFAETQRFVPRVQQYFERYTLQQYRASAEDSRF